LKGLILAAGRGSRIRGLGESKPLIKIAGRPIIEHVLATSVDAGIDDVTIVTGHREDALRDHVRRFASRNALAVTFISNFDLNKENGHSAWLAKDRIQETFVLLMADHLFDKSILQSLIEKQPGPGEIILAVDFRLRGNNLVNLEDVTKVAVENGRITAIGKTLACYNGFDTGIFLCTPALFAALEDSRRTGDTSLSGGIRVLAGRGRARAMDIGAHDWIDIDDEEDLRKAQTLLGQKG